MPLILCSWVRNPSSDLTIAEQIITRVNCRGNSARLRCVALPYCTRTHTQRAHLPALPPVGSGKCSALKPPQPARHKCKLPGLFYLSQNKSTSPGRIKWKGFCRGARFAPQACILAGCAAPAGRLASSGGQSLQLIIAGDQIVAQRATRAQKERAAITRSSPSVRLSPCRPCRPPRAAGSFVMRFSFLPPP